MPDEDATTPARQRLGRLIDDRREAKGLAQRDVVRHSVTYANLVAGRGYKRATVRSAFRALGWDPDSVEDVLAGGMPRPLTSEGGGQIKSSDTDGDVAAAFEIGGRVAAGWPAMSEEDRQKIIEIADEAHKLMH